MTFFPQVRRVRTRRRYRIYLFSASARRRLHRARRTGAPPAPQRRRIGHWTGNSSIPSEITVTWQGVPTTGPTAASTYIVEAELGAANVAVFDTEYNHPGEESATNGRCVRVRAANACGAAPRRQKPL